MSNKRFAPEPEKGPPLGAFDVEKADELTKPKTPAFKYSEDLNLYTKPPSVKPEPGTAHIKPFGSDAKGGVIPFGRQVCYPCMNTKFNKKAHKKPGAWI
jgi:hypothetical protein